MQSAALACLVLVVGVGYVAAQGTSKTQGKFVFDLLKVPLSAAEVAVILADKDSSYPKLASIPQTGFKCSSKAQPGFYADVDAQCQVFHRCDQNGNQTDFLCVNSTIFNQITLVCDNFYNVDCSKSVDYENFANSRLYTNQPLFDTPPADYVSPGQLVLLKNQGLTASGAASSSSASASAAVPHAAAAAAAPAVAASTAAPVAAPAAAESRRRRRQLN